MQLYFRKMQICISGKCKFQKNAFFFSDEICLLALAKQGQESRRLSRRRGGALQTPTWLRDLFQLQWRELGRVMPKHGTGTLKALALQHLRHLGGPRGWNPGQQPAPCQFDGVDYRVVEIAGTKDVLAFLHACQKSLALRQAQQITNQQLVKCLKKAHADTCVLLPLFELVSCRLHPCWDPRSQLACLGVLCFDTWSQALCVCVTLVCVVSGRQKPLAFS